MSPGPSRDAATREAGRSYEPRSIARNFRAAFLGEGVSKGAAFLATIVVARSLSSAEFGRFSFVVALVGVAILVSDVGLQVAATRFIAADRARGGEYVLAALVLGGGFGALSYGALVGAGWTGLLPLDVTAAVAIFGIAVLLTVGINAFGSLLRGFERQDLIYVAYSVSSLALLAGVVAAGRADASIETLLAIYVVSYAVRLALTLAFVRLRISRPRWRFEHAVLRTVALAAPAAALAYVLQGVYSHVDVVLLGFLVAAAEVGHYAAAYRLIDGVTFLTAGAMTAAVFPVFSRLAREAPDEVGRLYDVVMRLMASAVAPVSLLLVAGAGPIVRVAYGPEEEAAARLFALLAPSTLLIALNFTAAFVALAIGQTRVAIACTGTAAAVNVVANLVGVPLFGVEAAAVATLIGEVVMLLLFAYALRRTVPAPRALRASAVAVVVASPAVALAAAVPERRAAIGIVGACVAVAAVAGVRLVRRSDVRRLRLAIGARAH